MFRVFGFITAPADAVGVSARATNSPPAAEVKERDDRGLVIMSVN